MFIRSFDLITPKITLYFNGRKTHSSIFSGALTIIAYTLILTMSIYFSLDLIKRQNPSVFYLNRFIDDAGIFPMNSSTNSNGPKSVISPVIITKSMSLFSKYLYKFSFFSP